MFLNAIITECKVTMKDILRKIIAVVSLFLALSMILFGGLGYLLISHEPQSSQLMSQTQKEFAKNKSKRQEKIDRAQYDGEVTHVEGAAIAQARENYSSSIEDYGIGSVYIPTSNISVPLLAGTSEWNLLNGVATASASQKLGEGLYIGISHNLVNQRLLQNIDQAKKGDLVYLTDFSDVYIYKITEQKVVHETESSYLKEPKAEEDPKLLLYRCEGEFNTDWRRIIYGDYLEKKRIEDLDDDILSGLMIDYQLIDSSEELDGQTPINHEESKQEEESQIEDGRPEENSKNIFEKTKINIINFISQNNFLSRLSLRVYSLADSHTFVYIMVILLLFLIYYLI